VLLIEMEASAPPERRASVTHGDHFRLSWVAPIIAAMLRSTVDVITVLDAAAESGFAGWQLTDSSSLSVQPPR
jgi:hypothetical protein